MVVPIQDASSFLALQDASSFLALRHTYSSMKPSQKPQSAKGAVNRMINVLTLICVYRILAFAFYREPSMQPVMGGDGDLRKERVFGLFKPWEKLSMQEMVENAGLPLQKHTAATSDGYILDLYRIPKLGRPPVLLVHGVADDAYTWVNGRREQSLAYVLSDAGFDVWMGNCRGASRGHTTLQQSDPEFWSWTIDDLVDIDLPTFVDYVLEHSEYSTLGYVGHSQGSLLGFLGFSTDHTLYKKINAFVALAPAGYFKQPTSILSPFLPRTTTLLKSVLWVSDLVGPSARWHVLDAIRNGFITPVTAQIPNVAREILCGIAGCGSEHAESFELDHVERILSHYPCETSLLNIIHFAQLFETDQISRFDHGTQGNLRLYQQPTPPPYPSLSKLGVPVHCVFGGEDKLVSEQNARETIARLPVDKVVEVSYMKTYGHADFIWGKRVGSEVFPSLIRTLHNYSDVREKGP